MVNGSCQIDVDRRYLVPMWSGVLSSGQDVVLGDYPEPLRNRVRIDTLMGLASTVEASTHDDGE